MTLLAEEPGEDCCNVDKVRLHHGTPKGLVKDIGGLQTYITSPPVLGNRILLFFPDVHGPFFINNQLLMDFFASKGYLVISPDYFEGNTVQEAKHKRDFDRASWIQWSFARAKRVFSPWMEEILNQFGDTEANIGAVGYCFGAAFVLDLCKTNRIVAGAIAHPAFLEDHDFQNLKQPLLISCAEIDNTFTSEARHKSEEILKETGVCYYYELFSGVRHGFALRGNMDDENECKSTLKFFRVLLKIHAAWARQRCADSVISWMDRFTENLVIVK